MIREENTRVADIPTLLVYRNTPQEAAKKGTILFYHGLAANKETGVKELNSLAEAGYLAVAVDNVGHGERRYEDFDHRFSGANPNLESDFTQAVAETAEEVPKLIDALCSRYGANEGKFAVAGISMGGFIAYRAIHVDKRLKVATPILGSPKWKIKDSRSPHENLNRFYPCAILSQNAGADESVPPAAARDLHQQLSDHYVRAPEKHKYVEFPNVGHFMPEDDWNRLWSNVLDWLNQHL